MDPEQRLQQHFASHMETVSEAAMRLTGPLVRSAGLMVDSLLQGGKIMACGNGGCAATAQHFVARLVDRYQRERPGLPAIALGSACATLTAIADERGFSQVFARQLGALGRPGDVLLAICANGGSENIAQGIREAIERDLKIVLLGGGGDDPLAGLLREQDVRIHAPGEDSARIQEIHLLGVHCLCDLIDTQLLGS